MIHLQISSFFHKNLYLLEKAFSCYFSADKNVIVLQLCLSRSMKRVSGDQCHYFWNLFSGLSGRSVVNFTNQVLQSVEVQLQKMSYSLSPTFVLKSCKFWHIWWALNLAKTIWTKALKMLVQLTTIRLFFYSVFQSFRSGSQESILTTFIQSIVFRCRWGIIDNWLMFKFKPPLVNLACSNLRNTLCKRKCFSTLKCSLPFLTSELLILMGYFVIYFNPLFSQMTAFLAF